MTPAGGPAGERGAATRPRLDRRRVALVRVDDEAVLLDLGTYRATRANPVAARAMALCDGRRSLAEAARDLGAAFGVPRRRALADLRRLLAELDRRGFLRRSAP